MVRRPAFFRLKDCKPRGKGWTVSHGIQKIRFPETALVGQSLFKAADLDAFEAVEKALFSIRENLVVRPGQTVAVGVGSRNIDRIGEIVAKTVEFLRDLGLSPFLVPAMGSHGGATPEGQIEVLESLGVKAAGMAVPVRAGMGVRELGRLGPGCPVFFSEDALSADHVVIINRIKPHTKFTLPIESGLLKMLSIGLGKEKGAAALHRAAAGLGFGIIERAGCLILEKIPLLFGLALLEDGFGKLSGAHPLLPENLVEGEKSLLKEAYALLPRVPFDKLDILVIDRIGKDISGIGMDSNVTGRHRDLTGDFNVSPRPKRIFVRELSEKSGGNANGIGLADFTTSRLVAAIDRKKTYLNALAAISPEKAAVPMHFDTDSEALSACLETCGCDDPQKVRLVRIKDTAHLDILEVSAGLAGEIAQNPSLSLVSDFRPMIFDSEKNLISLA